MDNVISVKNLCVEYDGVPAIKNLSFDICEKDRVVVVGENGTGKTTLIKAILGLVKIKSGSVKKKYSQIGYLPQKSYIKKDFPASVMEVVQCYNKTFYTKQDYEQGKKCLEKLSILSLENTPFNNLSGGQQQRVLLARALNASKGLLILDEPVSGLDPYITQDFYQLLKSLDTTVLMVTHDVLGALDYGEKILHLGKNTFYGSKEEYNTSGVNF